jgi:hypothetical protein
MDAQATGDAFSPQKKTSSTVKQDNSLLFSPLVVIFALLDPDPDKATQINVDPDPQPLLHWYLSTILCACWRKRQT